MGGWGPGGAGVGGGGRREAWAVTQIRENVLMEQDGKSRLTTQTVPEETPAVHTSARADSNESNKTESLQ